MDGVTERTYRCNINLDGSVTKFVFSEALICQAIDEAATFAGRPDLASQIHHDVKTSIQHWAEVCEMVSRLAVALMLAKTVDSEKEKFFLCQIADLFRSGQYFRFIIIELAKYMLESDEATTKPNQLAKCVTASVLTHRRSLLMAAVMDLPRK